MAFRRQAANRGSLDWGLVDDAARYCLGDTHSSQECTHAPTGPGPTSDGSPTPPVRRPQGGNANRDRGATVEICRLFNSPGGSRCKYPFCRYVHLCIKCRRPHPVAECGGGDRERRQSNSTSQTQGSQAGSQPPASS